MGIAEQAMPQADEATRRFQARRLQQILWVLLVAVSVIALQNLWVGVWHTAALLLATDGALLLALRCARRGQVEYASLLMLWTLTVLLTLIIWAGQGLRDSGVIGFPGILVFAAMLGNRRQLVTLLGFMLLSFGLLALVNLQGWYVNPRPPVRLGTFVDMACILSVIGFSVWLMAADLHGALARLGAENLRVRQSQEQITFLAHHDALTGLPNRVLARDRCEQAIVHAAREQGAVALLFLDLDNFKTINDSLGHVAGDAVLQQVARRLEQAVGGSDSVCRQSGDEFLIILDQAGDSDAVAATVSQLLAALVQPIHLNEMDVTVTCSLGIAQYPQDGADFDTLLKHADTAMYRAKDDGRNAFRFFDAQMNSSVAEHLQLISGMRVALQQNQFVLYYQPQFELASGRLVGVEALLRWLHPQQGLITPTTFIPLAEKSGLIIEIGTWVVQEACRQAVQWQQAGLPPLLMSVNLSPVQVRRAGIEQVVLDALADSGLAADQLELELTESMLIDDSDGLTQLLGRLRERGVGIAIDDFGTGYSNLGYLKRFAVERLKIDQSFIRHLSEDGDNEVIVRAIIQMAHSLKLMTVAEGIEDAATLARLSELGCDRGQGFHWAPALPAAAFQRFAEQYQGMRALPV